MPSARGVSGVAAAATLVLLGSAQAHRPRAALSTSTSRLGFIEHQLDDRLGSIASSGNMAGRQ